MAGGGMTRCEVDFLGIGATRAGTSWLWENLTQHPGIWMPPRKELHYFDRSPKYPSGIILSSDPLTNRLFGGAARNKRFRSSLREDLLAALRRRNWEEIRWFLRYYLGTYNDLWYASLFKYGGDRTKGEITPAYSMLEPEDVKHIHSLFPEIKIIFLLRDPIERAWSHIRFVWTKGRTLNNLEDIDAIKKFVESPGQSLRGDYMRTIDAWSSSFSEKQMFIGFYDDIVQSPEKLFSSILQFLEVHPIEIDKCPGLYRKINASREKEMPLEIRYYLAKKYRKQIEQLSHLVGSHALSWLKEAENIIEVYRERKQ